MTDFGNVKTDVRLDRSVILTIDDFRKGVSAPADTTIATTPTIPALTFNDTNELLSAHIIMPQEWDKTADCSFDLVFCLASVQSNNDVLSVTIDYVAIKKNTTGAGFEKTSTQNLSTVTVTTANGLAIGDTYVMVSVLSAADSNNGFSSGDNVIGFGFEFHLTNTTGVADINFVSGCINYVCLR